MKHPTSNIQHPTSILLVLALLALVLPAQAELTAVVSPGYQFIQGERPTVGTLNRLGLPTITITGTLDGTNAGISAGSINANMFSASVVDNATIYFTNSSPQALAIKSAGVGVREISSAIAGPGLTGGSGVPLTNSVDGVRLLITNDVVTLATNIPLNYLAITSNTIPIGHYTGYMTNLPVSQFYTNLMGQVTFSTTLAMSSISGSGLHINTAHGLGSTPVVVHGVLQCTSTDLGYAAGDEVPLPYLVNSSLDVVVTVGANATNVFFMSRAAPSTWRLPEKSTGVYSSAFNTANWTVKITARP
jgi:hypothetical protein